MRRIIGKAFALAVLLFVAWIAIGGAMTALAGSFQPRGDFVDIGGREIRIVCEGPTGAQPTVLMESGAFGLAADFGALQAALAAKGIRSCAYDRAGLGWSDPGPGPRDSEAIVSDLEALLKARGEMGPFIVMGHSMAGLHVRLFAARNAPRIAGLVLVEATTPEAMSGVGTQRFVKAFVGLSNTGAVLASLGALKPMMRGADRIGLPEAAAAEKRRAFAAGRHNRTAAAEVRNWRRSAEQAGAAAPYDPAWPVAVIVAGSRGETIDSSRGAPAKAARHGSFEVVSGAGHASVLGGAMNGAVVRGVEFVLAHQARP